MSMSKAMVQKAVDEFRTKANGQVVLVLQGDGALGAYHVGVHEALHQAGVEPDWIIGTSIGAINASIIAGNRPQDRAGCGCVTQMHVVRLLAPRLENENHTKDIDFTPSGPRVRREAATRPFRERSGKPRGREGLTR